MAKCNFPTMDVQMQILHYGPQQAFPPTDKYSFWADISNVAYSRMQFPHRISIQAAFMYIHT